MENTMKLPQRVFLMCGPSGSGKSTIAQKLWQEYGGHYVSRDQCRFSLLKEGDSYFDHEDQVFEDFIKIIRASIQTGENVYIDATHLTPKARHKTLVRLQPGDYKTIAVCVEVPVEIALERNTGRAGYALVPETVIKNMHSAYRRPKYTENWFDEIWIVDSEENITKEEWNYE